MDIVYLGHSSFRLKGKTGVIVTDPFDSEKVGLKFPKVDATIVTISHDHFDHNQANLVDGEKKIVKGPGEYEIAGISIVGIQSFHDDKKGAERGKNTIFVIEIDNLRICHLGDLGHKLGDEEVSEIGSVDILMLPVGGIYTIDGKTAVEVAAQIGPSITIPMHYKIDGAKDGGTSSKLGSLHEFLSHVKLPVEKLPKLSIKEVGPEEERVVCLTPSK